MKKIYSFEAGRTSGTHTEFLKKLKKKGAKVVKEPLEAHATIVFCPIVTRFETDIESALSRAVDLGCQNLILVAMHHTFDKNYTLPQFREVEKNKDVLLFVDCLFFEKEGLLRCPCNDKAVKMVRHEVSIKDVSEKSRIPQMPFVRLKGMKRSQLNRLSHKPHLIPL